MPSPKLNDKRWSIDLEKRIKRNTMQMRLHIPSDMASIQLWKGDIRNRYTTSIPERNMAYWSNGSVQHDRCCTFSVYLEKSQVPLGVDRNGINVEFTVEKNTGRKMKTYDRSEFLSCVKKQLKNSLIHAKHCTTCRSFNGFCK